MMKKKKVYADNGKGNTHTCNTYTAVSPINIGLSIHSTVNNHSSILRHLRHADDKKDKGMQTIEKIKIFRLETRIVCRQ